MMVMTVIAGSEVQAKKSVHEVEDESSNDGLDNLEGVDMG